MSLNFDDMDELHKNIDIFFDWIPSPFRRANVFCYFSFSQIVKGLQALHDNGFFCPNLKGADIAIKMNNNSIDAKIWNFTVCTSGKIQIIEIADIDNIITFCSLTL